MSNAAILRPDPKAAAANPKAISVRIKARARIAAGGQRRHDLRIGRQPKYVDGSRSHLNRVLLEPIEAGALRKICDARRDASGIERARRVSDSVAVATLGIITFGHEAQKWVEAMGVEQQDGLFQDVANRIAARLNTSLHGLVVHLDESAIHAHFQLAATTHDGRPVSKVAVKSVLNDFQTIAAEVARRYDPRIERGHRKLDRLKAGATVSDVTNRSVRELHEDLPREIEAQRAEADDLRRQMEELKEQAEAARVKLENNERLAARAHEKAQEAGAKAEKAAKNAATYERRAAAARRELDGLSAELDKRREMLTDLDRQRDEKKAAIGVLDRALAEKKAELERCVETAKAAQGTDAASSPSSIQKAADRPPAPSAEPAPHHFAEAVEIVKEVLRPSGMMSPTESVRRAAAVAFAHPALRAAAPFQASADPRENWQTIDALDLDGRCRLQDELSKHEFEHQSVLAIAYNAASDLDDFVATDTGVKWTKPTNDGARTTRQFFSEIIQALARALARLEKLLISNRSDYPSSAAGDYPSRSDIIY